MKKLSFLLLTVACIALVGCNKNKDKNNEPTEPVVPATETESDFILKFYTSDSLLQYVDFTIVDTLDATINCSNYTITKLDTLNADKEDWEMVVKNVITMFESTGSLTYDNTKVITLKTHLAKNSKQHAFRIRYTRNKVVDHSGEINFILGGSVLKSTSSPKCLAISAQAHTGVYPNQITTFFGFKSAIGECTLSFVY